MGGNVQVLSLQGEEIRANSIDLQKIGRSNFVKTTKNLFKALNTIFETNHNKRIWKDENVLEDALVFNGSTSFVMSNQYSDDEILKVKPTIGDIDIAVPMEHAEQLFEILERLKGKKVLSNVEFVGLNRTSNKSLGTQINTIFKYKFDEDILVQVDFELLPFEEDGQPSEWARFSHSSSFEDAKVNVKAVHHKYLIRALIGALSVRDDIVIATAKSPYDDVRLSKKDELPRMLKFSVDHGVRVAYSPFLRPDGTQVYFGNKKVYKEIPTKESDYKKNVLEIYTLAFGEPNEPESKLLWTFQGTLKLIKKHLKKDQIELVSKRYFEMLWGIGAQKLVRDDPEEDASIKGSGWELFKETLKVKEIPQFDERLKVYYSKY